MLLLKSIFGKQKIHAWHDRIDSIAAGTYPISPEGKLNLQYPWAQLQTETAVILRRKRSLSQEEQDSRLSSLIQKHGNKHVAIAACAQFISAETLRSLFTSKLKFESGKDLSIHDYLLCLAAANNASEGAIKETLVTWACAFFPFLDPGFIISNGPAAVLHFKTLAKLMSSENYSDLVSQEIVFEKVNGAIKNFTTHLQRLLTTQAWWQAHQTVRWLVHLADMSGLNNIEQAALLRLLDGLGRARRTWQYWRPQVSRIELFYSLDIKDREKWHKLIFLEGPDLTGNYKSTLREGLLTQGCEMASLEKDLKILQLCGDNSTHNFAITLSFKEPETALDIVYRLSYAFDAYCRSGTIERNLFTHLFYNKPIESRSLDIFGDLINFNKSTLTTAVARLIKLEIPWSLQHLLDMSCVLSHLKITQVTKLETHLELQLAFGIANCFNDARRIMEGELIRGEEWVTADLALQAIRTHFHFSSPIFQSRVYDICPSLQSFVDRWPSHDRIRNLDKLLKEITSSGQSYSNVSNLINSYCFGHLLFGLHLDPLLLRLSQVTIEVCDQLIDNKYSQRSIAFCLVNELYTNIETDRLSAETDTRWLCLKRLPTLSAEVSGQLNFFFSENVQQMVPACSVLSVLLSKPTELELFKSFKPLLRGKIKYYGCRMSQEALERYNFHSWCSWIQDVIVVCDSMKVNDLVDSFGESEYPNPLSSMVYQWNGFLQNYKSELQKIDLSLGCRSVMQCILRSYREPRRQTVLRMLDLLSSSERNSEECISLMWLLMGQLMADGSNIDLVVSAMAAVVKASKTAIGYCKRLFASCYNNCEALAKVMLVSWLHPSLNMAKENSIALNAVGSLFGLQVDSIGVSASELKSSSEILDRQVKDLFEKAEKLNNLRLALKFRDPVATEALLKRIGMKSPVPAEEAIASLPPEIMDVVEKVGDQAAELHFPLTEFRALKRIAMDVGAAKLLLVRLTLDFSATVSAFCIHLDRKCEEANLTQDDARGWMTLPQQGSWPLDTPLCLEQPSRTLYQLVGILRRFLDEGSKSVNDVYTLIACALKNLCQRCIACGKEQKVILRRATTCSAACSTVFTRASLGVRLVDLRQDVAVVDLLLTPVHAAAVNGKSALMPYSPIQTYQIFQTLKRLPSLATLIEGCNISVDHLELFQADKLLLWALTSYRGFLASATGNLRIPNMPGAYQFVLANTTPDLEHEFASKLGTKTPKILFHGTHIDRLYAILCQGLRVCSNTPLMANGAARGAGIYMTDEPQTAMGYARVFRAGAASGWRNGTFKNISVLLGCEYAGSQQAQSNRIWVVTDPTLLILRFIFIMPFPSRAPSATHVVPAIQSVCASLRSGTA